VWRPRSDAFELLRAEGGLTNLSPAIVFSAVKKLMDEWNSDGCL
jgi:hypothetical protein